MEWENYWVKSKSVWAMRSALVCFLVVGWVWKQEKKKIYYSLRKQKKQILQQAVFSLGFFALFHFILKFFWSLMVSSTNLPHKSTIINNSIEVITGIKAEKKFGGLIGILAGMCILAPLVEECIFRYLIFSLFGKKNIWAYFFSFFTFILAHYHWGENILVLFFQYSVASFALIYIYRKSNWNLLAPILLHSLINLLFIGITIISPNCSLI